MLRNTIFSLLKGVASLNLEPPVRNMSRVKKRFTVAPFWQPMKTRVISPEHITSDNQDFLRETIEDKYSSPLKTDPFERGAWEANSYRCGLITKKIGVCPVWRKDGKRGLSTLLQVSDNHVIKYICPEELQAHDINYKWRVQKKDRPLGALVVGADSGDPRQFTKEYFTLFETAGVMPKRRLAKFYITPNAQLPPGMPLLATHFRPGDFVDCAGLTVDRGFQGVMKRWGFKGNRASHGVTKSHRRGGNIGGGAGAKARVWPGTKMPGHMGRLRRILRGAKVLRINTKHNVIWVEGTSIPGETGNYVILYDSILPQKQRTEEHHKIFFPTSPPDEDLPVNMFDNSVHDLSHPSIVFEQDKVDKKKKK